MAKKLDIIGNKAIFDMTLKGGDLPDGFEAEISVEMDFSGASNEQLYKCCASGQSARVALQGQLRKKPVLTLGKYHKEGLKVKFTDIIANDIVRPMDRLLALSKESFTEVMVEELGMDENAAEALYNKKHGIE